jgi:hypothetical protein
VAPPTFEPTTSSFTTSATLVVKCATPGAEIFYTTDGSEPEPLEEGGEGSGKAHTLLSGESIYWGEFGWVDVWWWPLNDW